MIKFSGTILRFDKQGEKTGWTYIEIASEIARQIKPGTKKIFRVKGKIDNTPFEGISLMPMGGGNYIMPLNASLRKELRKNKGASVLVCIEEDKNDPLLPPEDFLLCLEDEPTALDNYNKLPSSYRRHYVRWIIQAKTENTRAGRIADAVNSLAIGVDFGEMMRNRRKNKQ